MQTRAFSRDEGRIVETSRGLEIFGRILLAAIFVTSGVGKLVGWPAVVGSIGGKGVPFPEIVGVAVIVLELCGALALVSGWGAGGRLSRSPFLPPQPRFSTTPSGLSRQRST